MRDAPGWGRVPPSERIVVDEVDREILTGEKAENNYEGDRFKIEDTDYYYVSSTLKFHDTEMTPITMPTWAILDEEEGGYIAFCTSEKLAEDLVRTLNQYHKL